MIVEQKQLDFTCGDIVQMSADVCERKHGGNAESRDAHERILNEKSAAYEKIMKLYRAREDYGATSHEVSASTGMPLQTVSARLSELRHILNKLEKKGERRNHAAVLVEAGMGYAIQVETTSD